MTEETPFATDWRRHLPTGVRPYTEIAPLAALFLGISSGFPYAMIGATLTTRLAQDGIDKKTVTAFSLAFLVYNLKFLWAPLVDGVRLPLLGRLGQRVSWLLFAGALVMAAVINLALVDPQADLGDRRAPRSWSAWPAPPSTSSSMPIASKLLQPQQLGVGAGMSQYGWRIGSVAAGALALMLAAARRLGMAYIGLRRLRAAGDAHRAGDGRTARACREVAAHRSGRPSCGARSARRWSSSSRARAPGWCCCSSCCTRSATPWPT
jgi:PAT family beta-lactamase induction signal transducer AmpG